MAAAVNKQLRDELAPAPQGQPLHRNPGSKSRSSPDPLISLAKRVSSKLEDGDYKGAVLLSCSEDSFATIDADTPSTLKKEKHPSAHPDTCFPSVPEMSEAFARITEKEVAMGIKSFPSGSTGGPDGLRPQHLKVLTSESAERGGRELLSALTSFINHILQGNAPLSVHPILFGATLIALHKKEGGICPIAIGLTLHCLAAKIGVFHVVQSVSSALAPLQLGYEVPSGCEAILSEEGVQQGDPLGPLLFCLTLHPLLSQLQSELKIFYLDAGTIGGSSETVLHDLHYLESGWLSYVSSISLNRSSSVMTCSLGK